MKGLLCGLVATMFWGGFYPVSRLLFGYEGDSVEPMNFTFIRFTLAALFLLPIFVKKDNRDKLKILLKKDLHYLAMLSLVGIVGEGMLVFCALKYTTAARASLMANASPISTLIISWLAGKELLTGRKITGMLLGFAGLVIAFLGNGDDQFATGASMFKGDFMAFASGVCWALYTVYGDRVSNEYGGLLCGEVMFVIAMIVLLPATLWINKKIILDLPWQTWLGAIYLGMLSYGLANSLWICALKYLKPGQLGSFGYLSAAIAMTCSAIFVNEKFTITFFIAIALVLIGVALMLHQSKPTTESKP